MKYQPYKTDKTAENCLKPKICNYSSEKILPRI